MFTQETGQRDARKGITGASGEGLADPSRVGAGRERLVEGGVSGTHRGWAGAHGGIGGSARQQPQALL